MKLFRKILRYWIGIASVLSFLGGWVILAHSPKPVQLQSNASSAQPSAASPTLPAIQAYGATTSNGMTFFSTTAPGNSSPNNTQSIQPVQPSQSVPLLRTRGS